MKKLLIPAALVILTACNESQTETNRTTTINKATEANVNQDKKAQFVWDFSKQKTFVYSFTQTVQVKDMSDKNNPPRKNKTVVIGKLKIEVKPEHKANLKMTDIKMNVIEYNLDGTSKDTLVQQMPGQSVADMNPDGSFANSNHNILFDILFPLPKTDLSIGGTEALALEMPFTAEETALFIKGQNALTFSGYETYESKECAVLKGTIDVSELDLPEHIKGNYKSAATGEATYYFDLDNQYYVGAEIHLLMEALMDTPEGVEGSEANYFKMENDNYFKIKFDQIEQPIIDDGIQSPNK